MAGGLTAAGSPGVIAARFPALRHRNFRRYVLGQGVSLIGFWTQSVAQSWLVYRLSGSAVALGAVSAASYFPVLLVAPLAGVLADRMDKRRLVMVTQSTAMVLAFTLGVLVTLDRVTVAGVAVFAFLLGVVGAVDLPTRQAFIVEMVGPEDLSGAIALNASVFNSARVIGPAIAGALVALVGEGPCCMINGVSYGALLWALAGMRLPAAVAHGGRTIHGGLRSGLRYVRHHPTARALLLALGVVSALSLQVNVLFPVLARQVFAADARGYGLLLTAFGAGAVVSALALAWGRADVAQARWRLVGGLAGFGVGFLGLALTNCFAVALVCNLIAGLGMVRYTATTNALLQLRVDDEFRGRVMGLHTVMFMGTSPVGSLLLGAMAEHWGPAAAVTTAGCAPLLTAVWLLRRL